MHIQYNNVNLCVIRARARAIVCVLVGTNSSMPELDHARGDAGFHFIKLLLQLPLSSDSELFHPLLG